jgi:hypothetical protein
VKQKRQQSHRAIRNKKIKVISLLSVLEQRQVEWQQREDTKAFSDQVIETV